MLYCLDVCVCVFFPLATPGSESPGQAVEAEEVMKQLDMEEVDEIPSSTPTCAEGISLCPADPHLSPDTTVEEGEIVTETDMPPLTCKHGLQFFQSIKCTSYSIRVCSVFR